ncbi:MAG: hypothetical protein Salg2KO_07400 [Salibacteraceae bacterium]
MEITISDNHTINELQNKFNEHFPFLKIEFYKKEHEVGEGNKDASLIASDKRIGDIRTVHDTGDLSIHGNQKVSTLEGAFHDMYGLNVQVFRKSGDVWLQTTATDEWTLSEQNQTGEEHKV